MHFLIFLVEKSFLTKNYFHTAEIDLTTLVHCILVLFSLYFYLNTNRILDLYWEIQTLNFQVQPDAQQRLCVENKGLVGPCISQCEPENRLVLALVTTGL